MNAWVTTSKGNFYIEIDTPLGKMAFMPFFPTSLIGYKHSFAMLDETKRTQSARRVSELAEAMAPAIQIAALANRIPLITEEESLVLEGELSSKAVCTAMERLMASPAMYIISQMGYDEEDPWLDENSSSTPRDSELPNWEKSYWKNTQFGRLLFEPAREQQLELALPIPMALDKDQEHAWKYWTWDIMAQLIAVLWCEAFSDPKCHHLVYTDWSDDRTEEVSWTEEVNTHDAFMKHAEHLSMYCAGKLLSAIGIAPLSSFPSIDDLKPSRG